MNTSNFPTLSHQKDLIYFDAAAMAPPTRKTLEHQEQRLHILRTNVHRSVHPLGEETDALYLNARTEMAALLGTPTESLAFTEKTTLGLHKLMFSLFLHLKGQSSLGEIWVSAMEHHANYLPWQQLAKLLNLPFIQVPLTQGLELDYDWILKRRQTHTPLLFACTHGSNVTGVGVDLLLVRELLGVEPLLIIDGAQTVAHSRSALHTLPFDAYAFSGYKFGAPTGTGGLILSSRLIERLPAPLLAGGMLSQATHEETVSLPFPEGWEPGTPHIDGLLSMPTAYQDWHTQHANTDLLGMRQKAVDILSAHPGIQVLAPHPQIQLPIVSFFFKDWHAHDVGTLLAHHGFFLRVGQHCAHPFFHSINLEGTARISFGPYNTKEDLDAFSLALSEIL
jgi:selenocysteine lyase/cysteine desulfurase